MTRWLTVLGLLVVVASVAAACGGDSSGSGASPDDPLSSSAVAVSSNGYEYEIVSVTEDATTEVLNENQFNDPPGDGRQFFVVRINATRTAEADALFGANSRLRLSGPENVTYTTFDDRCGVVPDSFRETPELTVDESREGNLCWSVPSDQVGDLLLFEDALGAEINYQKLS